MTRPRSISRTERLAARRLRRPRGSLCNNPGAGAVAWRLGSQGANYTVTVQATLLDGQGYGVVFRGNNTGGSVVMTLST